MKKFFYSIDNRKSSIKAVIAAFTRVDVDNWSKQLNVYIEYLRVQHRPKFHFTNISLTMLLNVWIQFEIQIQRV